MRYCFIFPHAGALPSDYKILVKSLKNDFTCVNVPRDLDMMPVWLELIQKNYDFIEGKTNNFTDDYIFLGHSMGAMQAYFVTKLIEDNRKVAPGHIFLSSMIPPNPENVVKLCKLSSLKKEIFKNEILKLGGVSEKIKNNEKALHFFIDRIRDDLAFFKTLNSNKTKLKTNVYTIVGDCDKMYSFLEMNKWSCYSVNSLTLKLFRGGHFYLLNSSTDVANYIIETVLNENA